jgi:sigma-B regulation protein RsbU (phosphoserine phosphatase)
MILFVFPTMGSYKREMDHLGAYVTELVGTDYVRDILERTKDVYYNTPEEIRHEQFKDEYRDLLVQLVDDDFLQARQYMEDCRIQAEMVNVFLCFYDEEMDRFVFVIDGNDASKAFLPGQWVSRENGSIDTPKEVKRTSASRWFMTVDYGKAWGWTATDYIAIQDENEKIIGYLTIDASINDFALQVGWILAINLPFVAALLAVFIYLGNNYLYRRVIGPINKLAVAAKEYASVNPNEESATAEVFSKFRIDTGDEIEQLWETMVDMESDISAAMKRIVEATAREERIAAEMDFAKSIQLSAMPTNFDDFSDRDEFELFATMTPAKEVGGDFYDFFLIDDNHLGLVVADVSGKGVPAALFMMTCKSLIKSTALHGGTPAEIIQYVNDRLCEDNKSDMFVTVWLGILDIKSREITACSAGHEYPFVTDEDGNYQVFKEPHSVVCGAFEDIPYEEYSFTIPKNGRFFMYTDGVPEAQSVTEEMFGLDRIGECLNKYKDAAPKELVESMRKELADFSEGAEQFDDITMFNLWIK